MTSINKVKFRFVLLAVMSGLLLFPVISNAFQKKITVRGAVRKSLDLSLRDLRTMPEFHINAVALLKEKQKDTDKETLIEVADYGGVLLRDILEKAGMKYKRKWEPAVFVRVRGANKEDVVFSFGEIFYSSIGRSTLIAFRKNGKLLTPSTGLPQLIVSNDIRNGRGIASVSEIIVERVDIEMKVYEERKKDIVQPPTTRFEILDRKNGKTRTIALNDLIDLPKIRIIDKVQVGDCEGFHDVYSYEGTPLRFLLERQGFISPPYRYDRYVSITSRNGFCATYSIGELFNSRLDNNIIIAYKKDGNMLDETEGFAMMVASEDNTGGRSVKRISRIFIE